VNTLGQARLSSGARLLSLTREGYRLSACRQLLPQRAEPRPAILPPRAYLAPKPETDTNSRDQTLLFRGGRFKALAPPGNSRGASKQIGERPRYYTSQCDAAL